MDIFIYVLYGIMIVSLIGVAICLIVLEILDRKMKKLAYEINAMETAEDYIRLNFPLEDVLSINGLTEDYKETVRKIYECNAKIAELENKLNGTGEKQ